MVSKRNRLAKLIVTVAIESATNDRHLTVLSCHRGLFNCLIFFRQVANTFENFQSRSCQLDGLVL